mgnify:CR=1 FL=1|tara:strand:- start:61 stop:222 length:162 start_codon:yes stop_codon:yes gene_type:complete
MKQIIKNIYERMQEVADSHTNNQEEEQAYILELACLNEVLDMIEGFPWDGYEN